MGAISLLPNMIDALLAAFTTAVGPSTPVYDGLPPASTADPEYLVVGDDGSGKVDSTFDQNWAALGKRAKDELGVVYCVVSVQTGDTVLKPSRDRAFQLIGLCETALKDNVDLDRLVLWTNFTGGTYRTIQNTKGSAVSVSFTVTYKARLST